MSRELADQWRKEGYIIVRGLFDRHRCQTLLAIAESVIKQWRKKNPETGKPGGGASATVMRHLNHPGYFLPDEQEARCRLLSAIADQEVLSIGRSILGECVLFRCTSLFMNPEEQSQDGSWHRDSQFHCPDEADEQEMIRRGGAGGTSIQLQVALVPSDDVEVVPGSHLRWDTPDEYAIRRADGGTHSRSNGMPGALRVALEPGDAVAFNPCGLHRGRYHIDKLRRTLMLTYTQSSAPRFDYFSDQPWFLEEGYLAGLNAETRGFFERFIEQYRRDWKPAS
mgnify:CR=1 FL=1